MVADRPNVGELRSTAGAVPVRRAAKRVDESTTSSGGPRRYQSLKFWNANEVTVSVREPMVQQARPPETKTNRLGEKHRARAS